MFKYTKSKTVRHRNVSRLDPKTRKPITENESIPTLVFDVSTHVDSVIDMADLVAQAEQDIREFIAYQERANIVFIINDLCKLNVLMYGHETLRELQCKFKRCYVSNVIEFNPIRVDL